MSEQDLDTKNAQILLQLHKQEKLCKVLEEEYRTLTSEIEGLAQLMRERRGDISVDVYENVFVGGSFRKTIQDHTRAFEELSRLKTLASGI